MASLNRLTIDDVADDLRSVVGKLPRLPLDKPFVRRLARWLQPFVRAKRTVGVTVETRKAVRDIFVHVPDQRTSPAALFWIHGGGYIIGSPKHDAPFCAAVATDFGITAIAPAYGLAPENPFPGPLDDLMAAWRWLLENAASLSIDPTRIVIGGESAGGGLAAALVQRIHDEGGTQPIAQWLYCPMLDDRTAADRSLDARKHYLWDNALNAAGWRAYLGVEAGSPSLPPYAVPARREDLSGLPPTWIGVGSIDLFHDEDVAYADRLKAAGVPVQFFATPGGIHAFYKMAPAAEISRVFEADAREWLEARLAT